MDNRDLNKSSAPVLMDIQPPQPRSFAAPQSTSPINPPSTPPPAPSPQPRYSSGMGAVPPSQPPKARKKKKPILAIIVILIIVTGLAGVAVVYLKPNIVNDKAKDNTVQTTTPAEDADAGADEALKEVDEALAASDDSADFAESDLSDSSLGL